MSLKNRPGLLAESDISPLLFGISSLHNASLLADFYPEDLPQDWRLSYYSNEFNLLLLNLSDLHSCVSDLQTNEMPEADVLIASLTQLSDELDEDFSLLFDLSSCHRSTHQALLQWQQQNDFPSVLSLLDLNAPHKQKFEFCSHRCEYMLIPLPVGVPTDSDSALLLCLVHEQEKLSAVELKKLIEALRETGSGKTLLVLFSATQFALENTRNAIILESMM